MKKLVVLAVVSLVCLQGCAARSKTVIGGMAVDFNKNAPPTNLIVLIRTMTGPNPSAEDQAIISLAEIKGGPENFTQVLCKNPDGNLEVLLTPALIDVGGKDIDDHIEYFAGAYSLNFYLGNLDAKKVSPSQEAQRVGINFVDVHRPRQVFEMDTTAFGQWYITSASATKKGDRGWKSAKAMNCTTRNRTRGE